VSGYNEKPINSIVFDAIRDCMDAVNERMGKEGYRLDLGLRIHEMVERAILSNWGTQGIDRTVGVVAIQNVKLLGTELELQEWKTYRAIPAFNQPGYIEKHLYFVYPGDSRLAEDSILCTADVNYNYEGQIRLIHNGREVPCE
jgi:hypothetical protein